MHNYVCIDQQINMYHEKMIYLCYFLGDMLVGLNDIDVTWVNIDDLFRAACSQQEVKGINLAKNSKRKTLPDVKELEYSQPSL